MCEERRDDVKVVSMGGDRPEVKWSFNLTSLQIIAWMAAKIAALIVGVWAGVAFVANNQFDAQLEKFHTLAKPEIYRVMDEKIAIHKLAAEAPLMERLHTLENQSGQYDERLKSLKEASERNAASLDRIDAKLDRVLERLAR